MAAWRARVDRLAMSPAEWAHRTIASAYTEGHRGLEAAHGGMSASGSGRL